MNLDWLKQGASVLTAVVVALGGTGAIIFFMVTKTITADQGLPILTGILFGATGFLWGLSAGRAAVEDFKGGLNTTTPNTPEEQAAVNELREQSR